MIDRDLRRALAEGPRYALPRLVLDLGLWLTLAVFADNASPVAQVLLVLAIGVFPLHDILVMGHEATHGNGSRNRHLNNLVLWFCHALFGLSGRAYRAFHMDHHRAAHTAADSELLLYGASPTGASYLRMPVRSLWVVNRYKGRSKVGRNAVAIDLFGALALHAALAVAAPRLWALYLLAPVLVGLPVAVVLRAITEHHGASDGDAWRHTRATAAGTLLRLLWSNVDHHLEHHLAPQVPFHRLPALRRHLKPERAKRLIQLDPGLISTGLALLLEPEHIKPWIPLANRASLGHRLKVWWMRDILRVPGARQHLFSLYFHGEAYESLHPLGVWMHKLAPRWARKLRRQFDDENRHAELFRALLADDGALVTPVEGREDVGWYLLHHVVPDVCQAAGRPGPFTEHEALRYFGFLHALERRSIGDLAALGEAARAERQPLVAEVVSQILVDERVHALWTWRALCALAGADAAAEFAPIRVGEQQGTHAVLQHLIAVFESHDARPPGAWLRWRAMAAAARVRAAVPLLSVLPEPAKENRHAA